MDHGTLQNLEAAFGGESMANRKYLFFADLAKQLCHSDLARLFRETAQQETEHAFAHFRLLHPELVVENPDALDQEAKNALLARCLHPSGFGIARTTGFHSPSNRSEREQATASCLAIQSSFC